MSHIQKITHALHENWYTQGINAVPLYLGWTASSGMYTKDYLGYGYSQFLLHYSRGYAEMDYLVDDLVNVWKHIQKHLQQDKHYLRNIRNQYEETVVEYEEKFKKQYHTNDWSQYSLEELHALLVSAGANLRYPVAMSHVIEAIALEGEKEFKKVLFETLRGLDPKEFNTVYEILTTPSSLSFVAQEHVHLGHISLQSPEKQEALLERHFEKYHWFQNSYLGDKNLTVQDFVDRLYVTEVPKEISEHQIQEQKENVMKKYGLTEHVHTLVDMIDFTTTWQDDRKIQILINVGRMSNILTEVSKRVGVPRSLLEYMGVYESESFESFNNMIQKPGILKERIEGVYIHQRDREESIVSGNEHNDMLAIKKQLKQQQHDLSEDLYGSIANRGTAIGRVVICKTIADMDNVKDGDVLVTSMTRPEFMPALKKASAIVTDEGGITSHAAIVSRELNKPAVIGTKYATQILKDNMIVEVRANHGFIRILD